MIFSAKPGAVSAAFAALLWERSVRVWWPALLFPVGYVIAALLGLWEALGDPWRGVGFAAMGVMTLACVVWGLRGGPWPRLIDAAARVEEDSNLANRPFEALADAPSGEDPAGQALWRAHRDRMRRRLADARARRPRAALASRDPMALRAVAFMLVVVSVMAAGDRAIPRLSSAFAPEFLFADSVGAPVEAWIDPPPYTGRAPVFLSAENAGRRAEAPAGSTFVARVTGARQRPRLIVETGAGPERVEFEADGPGAFVARVTLAEDATLSVFGPAEAGWRVRVLDDEPPEIAFLENPAPGRRETVAFTYAARDDYAVTRGEIEIERADGEGEVERLPLAIGASRFIESRAETVNLTEHPWAGRDVRIRLTARDALDQVGYSRWREITLPQRLFTNALARAVVDERRTLLLSERDYAPAPEREPLTAPEIAQLPSVRVDEARTRIDRAPEDVRRVRDALELMTEGADVFEPEAPVHLGLSYVSERLAIASRPAELDGLEDVLWDVAIFAEGGELADAERAMRAAERALSAALARGASEEEIARLTREYQEAVDRYMEALMREAIEEGRVEQAEGGGQGMEGMSANEIEEFLRALRELTETGATDDARRLLQALSDYLANLEMSLTLGGQGGGNPLDLQDPELREQLERLSELMGEQRELMDRTLDEQEGREPREGGRPGDQSGGRTGEQEGENAGERPGENAGAGEDDPEGTQGGREPGEGDAGRDGGDERLGDGAREGDAEAGGRFGEEREGDNGVGAGEDFAEGEENGGGGLLEEQERIAELLQDLFEEFFGEDADGAVDGPERDAARQALNEALDSMRRAQEALREGDVASALPLQREVLERLRDAAERTAREAFEANRGTQPGGTQTPGSSEEVQRDPFGRRSGGASINDGLGVELPEELDRERSREYRDEIRRRAGEADREEEEREYLRRLLDRF